MAKSVNVTLEKRCGNFFHQRSGNLVYCNLFDENVPSVFIGENTESVKTMTVKSGSTAYTLHFGIDGLLNDIAYTDVSIGLLVLPADHAVFQLLEFI